MVECIIKYVGILKEDFIYSNELIDFAGRKKYENVIDVLSLTFDIMKNKIK